MIALLVPAFFMGLFGGLHCVAMCGGIVGVLCSAAPRCPSAALERDAVAAKSRGSRAVYAVAYNGGRITSYTLLGALFGALGTLSTGVFPLEGMRLALRMLAALGMFFVGLHLAGFPSFVTALESAGAPLWRRVAPLTARLVPLRSLWQAVALGSVWGLMPCGLLYGALALAASTESPAKGAATMATFGLATLPVMAAMSALATGVASLAKSPGVRYATGLLLVLLGLWSGANTAVQAGLDLPGLDAMPCCKAHT